MIKNRYTKKDPVNPNNLLEERAAIIIKVITINIMEKKTLRIFIGQNDTI